MALYAVQHGSPPGDRGRPGAPPGDPAGAAPRQFLSVPAPPPPAARDRFVSRPNICLDLIAISLGYKRARCGAWRARRARLPGRSGRSGPAFQQRRAFRGVPACLARAGGPGQGVLGTGVPWVQDDASWSSARRVHAPAAPRGGAARRSAVAPLLRRYGPRPAVAPERWSGPHPPSAAPLAAPAPAPACCTSRPCAVCAVRARAQPSPRAQRGARAPRETRAAVQPSQPSQPRCQLRCVNTANARDTWRTEERSTWSRLACGKAEQPSSGAPRRRHLPCSRSR